MKAKDVMTRDVVRVDKDERITTVLETMRKRNVSKLPVTENGKLVGIVVDGDIADELGAIKHRGVSPSQLHVTTAMRREPPVVGPETELEEIRMTMLDDDVGLVPVVHDGSILGVVTASDLLKQLKEEKPVSDCMTSHVIAVSPTDRVIHARRLMVDHQIERLPVLDGGRLAGIVGERDMALGFWRFKDQFPDRRQSHQLQHFLVETIMRRQVVTIASTATCAEAGQRMMENDVGSLPVMQGDRLVGILTRSDLLKQMRL